MLIRLGYVLLQFSVIGLVLALLFLSQRYWFRRAERFADRRKSPLRRVIRGALVLALLLMIFVILNGLLGRHRLLRQSSTLAELVGLWMTSSLLAYFAIRAVHALEWLWRRGRSLLARRRRTQAGSSALAREPVNLSRRYFFQTASFVAGAIPFLGFAYGFADERWRFEVREAELPVANLPPALDGMRIVQLSDIHIGSFMPVAQVRRAVGMANELNADLAVVTGDFLTGAGDPIEDCVAELSHLRAPLGIWGCNGNHEIYAGAEALAAELFRRNGMTLLRQERSELRWNGQALNLIGVDYQRQRAMNGVKLQMLQGVEPLLRPGMPNILLSHNPNSFPRAAELGIDLTLAGHTHGGQVRVEILDRGFSPAEFITPYVAGLYRRPLGAPSGASDAELLASAASRPTSLPNALIYVNRGLGTIAAPVRIGVPPEITLHTLRRAT
ncbi:MAG: metallophosphoesterase [Candidatus Acidiferrales bacterium]